jgi:DNA-binding beta-propeller fold protein YncE
MPEWEAFDMRLRLVLAMLCLLLVPASEAAAQEVGPSTQITSAGRKLDPAGKLTDLGPFPTGGALTPDGRFYWAVDAGRGANAVRIIDVASSDIVQTLPIPGGYVGVAFAPDGKRAYVSGEPAEGTQPPDAQGTSGDVVHVYDVNRAAGTASELPAIPIPAAARDGAAAQDELPQSTGVKAWPEGLAVTPDGDHLVVALGQADQAAIVDLASGATTLADVGRYPYGVAVDPTRPRAYVTNERDGTVSVISIPDGATIATIPVGVTSGPVFAGYAHPEGLAVDPTRDRLYVAVTDRDMVSVIDTRELGVVKTIDVTRPDAAIGSAPINVGVAPDGETLYVADAGEDAIVAIALTKRPTLAQLHDPGRYLVPRSVKDIGRYRRGLLKARRALHRRLAAASAQERKQARKAFHRRVRKLRHRFLAGEATHACGGPRGKADRRYSAEVLRAMKRHARARAIAKEIKDPDERKAALRRAKRKYQRAVEAARRRLPKLVECPPKGFIPGTPAFATIGRIPTAAYPTDVEATPDGARLVWLAAKGLGTGPNPAGESIKELLKGRAGVLDRPTDEEAAALTARADQEIIPTNFTGPPAGTPIVGPGGGPSEQIKHVFYIVKENRTYDQIFGSDPRGDGDPSLQVFDDNGVAGPAGGVTPNAHALSRQFSLLDHVFANSEESTVGHKITAGGYANDYTQRYVATNRGKKGNPDIFPIGIPPSGFIFDQAVRQSVGFHVYGELGAGNQPFANDGRPTYPAVQAATDPTYPSQIQGTCGGAIPFPPGTPNSVRCTTDAGTVGTTTGAPAASSRVRTFQTQFQSQLSSGTVPAFNYLILFNDHTNGTNPGDYTPRADVADNDLALGQVVELVSQSSIWDDSAIFVVEDDSQDGADHLDAHRIPVQVISPWAKTGGGVVSTRYDQYSFLRTIEMILGLDPLSINDALATPLYDAFISGGQAPDVEGTRYQAIQPEVPLTEVNPPAAPDAALSAALPFDQVDAVPQRTSDRILWHSIYGADSEPPPPGPGASPVERARAVGAMSRYRDGRIAAMRRFLTAGGENEDPTRIAVTARLLSAATGLSPQEARERIEGVAGADEGVATDEGGG